MQPLVSILFPCYNAEKYLRYSLESILNQDYKNLEIICINDGSSDSTSAILRDYKNHDDRIVIVNNESNIGLINSLNRGLKLVKGDYFARMDADDYSTPDRISEQVKFMQLNQDIDLVSSAYNYFYQDGQKKEYVAPIAIEPNALKFLSLFCTPLTHASVLGKSSLIRSALYVYDLAYPYAEDFELFSRLAWSHVKIGTVKQSLYQVRLHSESVSVKYNNVQLQTNIQIIKRNLHEYISINEDFDDHIAGLLACRLNSLISMKEIKQTFRIFDECIDAVKRDLTQGELAQIHSYLSAHKLNILIQVNKKNFRILGFRNALFFIRSLFLLKRRHFRLIFDKILH